MVREIDKTDCKEREGKTMTTTEKGKLMGEARTKVITLNGKAARICGRLMDFAQVVQIETLETYPVTPVEFSWSTVKRVVAGTGQFKS